MAPATGGQPAHRLVPFVFQNELSGHSYGAELTGTVELADAWRLQAWYADPYLPLALLAELGSVV